MHLFQFFEFFPPSPQGHVLFGARTLPYSSERTWPVFPNEIMNTKMLSSTLQNVINGRGYRCYRSSLLEWPTINTLCSFHDLHLRSGCVWHCCFQGIAIFWLGRLLPSPPSVLSHSVWIGVLLGFWKHIQQNCFLTLQLLYTCSASLRNWIYPSSQQHPSQAWPPSSMLSPARKWWRPVAINL